MPTLDEAKRDYTKFMLKDAVTQAQIAPLINEVVYTLNAAGVTPSITGYPAGTTVSNAQTGNGSSTAYDFGYNGRENVRELVLVRITTAVGTTPTCTYAIQGSNDASTWSNLSYADMNTPTVFASSTFVLTTATTVVKLVAAGQEYRYLQVTYSANTNVTNTADVYPLN